MAGSTNQGLIDGAGTAAAFNNPYGVAVDASGNVLVADTNNHRVRRVTPSGGTQTTDGAMGECFCFGFCCFSFWFSCPVPEFLITTGLGKGF